MSPSARRWGSSFILPVAWFVASAAHLSAQDLLVRRFSQESGLDVPIVHALAQDERGFLWIGTENGLYRYDGLEFQHWARDEIQKPVWSIATSRQGRVVAHEVGGDLFEVTAAGATPLPGPEKEAIDYLGAIEFDANGRLWKVHGGAHRGALAWQDPRTGWKLLSPAALGGEAAKYLRKADDGAIHVLTDGGAWRLRSNDPPEKLVSAEDLEDVVTLADGRLLALTTEGRILERRGGETRALFLPGDLGDGYDLAVRGATVWAGYDRHLVALRAGAQPVIFGSGAGIEGARSLLMDREGSLWVGSATALLQLPEPETWIWNSRHGLPSGIIHDLTRLGDRVWLTILEGTGVLRRDSLGRWIGGVPGWHSRYPLCSDPRGVLWVSTERGILEIREEAIVRRHPEMTTWIETCVADAEHGLWLSTGQGLRYVDLGSGSMHAVESPPGPGGVPGSLILDSSDRLWVSGREQVCHAPAVSVRPGGSPSWSCDLIPGIGKVTRFVELPGGVLWAGTRLGGVWAFRDGRWSQVAASETLPTRSVMALVPSPRGGVWIVGRGNLERVGAPPGAGSGWEVLERPGTWHGLPMKGGRDLIEEQDGTLWVATSIGVVRVPPEARFDARGPPRVALVEVSVDGRPISLDHPPELSHDRNRLELRFAALSYRDPSRVLYQVRLGPGRPWEDARGQPTFRWVDLRPGSYRAEVRASLDGEKWSEEPAAFAFVVKPPWYLEPWALALFALLGAALLWGIYRVRVGMLLRLERQRTRIAMDLHDEVGSGLGSIGILSGVIVGDDTCPPDSRRLAGEIAAAAEELGGSLSDIVWSLDPGTATLEELAGRLAEHGDRLFSEEVAFTTRFPSEWPPGELPLPVRGNVALIGLEALHNAARHARATRVELKLLPYGKDWVLAVQDDGVGCGKKDWSADAATCGSSGRGISSMERRAAEIGATFVIRRPTSSSGTTVTLRFRPEGSRQPADGSLLGRLRSTSGRSA